MPVDDQGKHFTFAARAGIWIVLHAVLTELLLLLQGFQNAGKELRILTAQLAERLAAAGSKAVLFPRRLEAFFVHIQALFAGDVT